jgi:restriction endonuclease S subunit
LNQERYYVDNIKSSYDLVALDELLRYEQPTKYIVKNENYNDDFKIPVLTAGKTFIKGYTSEEEGIFNELPVIIFDDFTTSSKLVDFPFKVKSSAMKLLKLKDKYKADIGYLYYLIQGIKIDTTEHRRYWISIFSKKEVPLPSIQIQKEIIKELEQYQKVIDGAKQVVSNYKLHIDIDNNWEYIELKELTEVITKGSTPTTYGYKFQEAGINFIKIENLNEEGVIEKDKLSFISQECYSKFKRSQLRKDDILFSIAGTKMGIIGYVEKDILPANTNQALCIIRLNDRKRSKFLFYYLKSNIIQDHLERVKVGVAQSNISLKQIGELRIPILNENQENLIVEKLEEERLIIEGNKKLIEVYTKKIEDRINKIWES